MLPLSDENPTLRLAIATIAIIVLNGLAWVLLQGFGNDPRLSQSICQFGLIPGEFLGYGGTNQFCVGSTSGSIISPLSSMFMHGGWFHVIGNMWFLWVFGDNVEDAMGPLRFVVFYLLCGLAAAAAQTLTDPQSLVPMVGASGAIGGVMGAYARLYPQARVHTLIFLGFFVTTASIPAIYMLGYWFLVQIVSGLPALGSSGGGVAFWAHVGGFVAGLLLIGPMQNLELAEAHRRQPARHLSKHRW